MIIGARIVVGFRADSEPEGIFAPEDHNQVLRHRATHKPPLFQVVKSLLGGKPKYRI